jgi:DNA processing protein
LNQAVAAALFDKSGIFRSRTGNSGSGMEEELIYLNALNRVPFLGPVRIGAMLKHFGSPRGAWEASPGALGLVPELKGLAERFSRERRLIDPVKQWLRLKERRIACISLNSPAYPPMLKQIAQPPPVLYYRGEWQERDYLAVAVVGSRRCTFYGKEVAYRLAAELSGAGLAVVSGMAVGIDSAAHQGALDTDGRTIAVLGCGPERCYPPVNTALYKTISESGIVLSEFPLDTKPLPQHFPQRNRIISGLSLGTVVVEATEKSGALITAHYALEQNREVFAVPGNVGSPYSRGCHRMLKEGARLVESVRDILDELALAPLSGEAAAASRQEITLPGEEKRILELIPYQPLHMDEIIRLSGISAAMVGPVLLNLELKGYLHQLPGKYFCRV